MVIRRYALLSFLCLGLAGLYGQDLAAVLDQANEKMKANDYASAQALLGNFVQANPANTGQVASVFTDIGVSEYNRRNFQNAYSAFREALKLQPTNQTATQYYLRMRREMDVAKLQNEYAPAPEALDAGQTSGAPAAAPADAEKTAQVDREEDLQILIDQLKVAEGRLSTIEGTASSKQIENDVLRQQIESQRQLVERMLAAQRTTAAAPSAAENARLDETIRLLSTIAERDQDRPVLVQSDPALQSLVEQLAANQRSIGKMSPLDIALIAAVSLVGVAILALVVFLLIAASRAKKRNARQYEVNLDGPSLPAATMSGGGHMSIGQTRSETPLLEFIESSPQNGENRDLAVRRDLLKAERLNRMYEDVRTGGLSWNTVRKYIGELELALRSEILKTVERKLDEGDLLSKEAILPVILPFLTDYDDFIREKAENLARRALISEQRTGAPDQGDGDPLQTTQDLDPLSLDNLMDIPRKLQASFKTQDQTLMTAKICRGMGAVLGLSAEDRNLLYKSALVHDCGYLMLDHDQLVRTVAKQEIDEEDFKFIQSHAVLGLSYFGEIELPAEMKGAILHHHERNDGSGYPDGLKKEEIPLFAKLIGISETFSALVSKRSYRDKRDVTHALAIISDGARSKFDAAHVDALIKVASTIGVI